MNLTTQHRSNDNQLLDFLQHIRYYRPTVEILSAIMEGHVLTHDNDVNNNIYNQLKLHPEATVLIMTRRAARFINETMITSAPTCEPIAVVIMNDQTMYPIHKSMRLMLTQNINEKIGFVNGQFVKVIGIENATIIAEVPNGHLINIHPITQIINEEQVTVYPCLPGYATTVCKVQGQTLPEVILWIDTDTTPHGTAYVAFSRVKNLRNLYFLTSLLPYHRYENLLKSWASKCT